MPPDVSAPDAAFGPLQWACLAHARGVPGEVLAWSWLAPRLPPGTARPARSVHGRPLLLPSSAGRRIDASWSHSGDLLLVAFGEGVTVGADIERIRPRRRTLDVARRYFTAAEAAWLEAYPESARDVAFTRLWCAKEAILKAHGRGLAFGLHRLAFAEDAGRLRLVAAAAELGTPDDWHLHEYEPAPGYRAALAWRPQRQAILQA